MRAAFVLVMILAVCLFASSVACAADLAKLTPKVLEANGFAKNPDGVYKNPKISLKKLCDLLGCAPKDFVIAPCPSVKGGPYEYIANGVCCIIEFLEPPGEKNIEKVTAVSATILLDFKDQSEPGGK